MFYQRDVIPCQEGNAALDNIPGGGLWAHISGLAVQGWYCMFWTPLISRCIAVV